MFFKDSLACVTYSWESAAQFCLSVTSNIVYPDRIRTSTWHSSYCFVLRLRSAVKFLISKKMWISGPFYSFPRSLISLSKIITCFSEKVGTDRFLEYIPRKFGLNSNLYEYAIYDFFLSEVIKKTTTTLYRNLLWKDVSQLPFWNF